MDENAVGDLLTLLSAFLYGVYTIVIRKALPDDERVSTAQVSGDVPQPLSRALQAM
jgi:drug/metabolite transporter (DMT)-like permease